jgi:FkbM family methyltransferase
MKFISYSQNFEDFMLWRALKNVREGFYISVGAYDPTEHSVTKYFYDNDWSGINIEPVIPYYKKFLLERPRDINLNLLISDKGGETVFYENDLTGLSSCLEDNIKIWQNESNFKFKKIKKTAKTLDTVCAENKVGTVHFLKIDVEGFEINVLHGFSFDVIRPWIVLFEAVVPTGDHRDVSSDCVAYLKSKKYHQVYFDGLNKFFVSDEHSELDNAFLVPINVFDNPDIQLSNLHWLIRDNVKELESISLKKEGEIFIAQQKIIDEINIELDSTKTKLDSTIELLSSTKSQLGQTVEDLSITKSQLDLIFHELSSIYASRGWKTIVFLYKISIIIIPKGSWRRKVVKYLWRYLKVPLKLFLKVARRFRKIFTTPAKVIQSSNSDDLRNPSPRVRKTYLDLKAVIKDHSSKQNIIQKAMDEHSSLIHAARVAVVSTLLPQGNYILDLGGAASPLYKMGYSHHFKKLILIDLPPDQRCDYYKDVVVDDDCPLGPVVVRYTDMTTLKGISDGSIDFVWSGESIEHVPLEAGERMCYEAFRVLRKGGVFCLDTPNRLLTEIHTATIGGGFIHPEHYIEYYPEHLIQILKTAGFIIKKSYGICEMPKTIATGEFHYEDFMFGKQITERVSDSYIQFYYCVKP